MKLHLVNVVNIDNYVVLYVAGGATSNELMGLNYLYLKYKPVYNQVHVLI